MPNYIL